jgi:uncharacterized protein (DUF433 family)
MNKHIQIKADVCHGKPVIVGTRVLVSTILGALGAGDSPETILEDYSNIEKDDIQAARDSLSSVKLSKPVDGVQELLRDRNRRDQRVHVP